MRAAPFKPIGVREQSQKASRSRADFLDEFVNCSAGRATKQPDQVGGGCIGSPVLDVLKRTACRGGDQTSCHSAATYLPRATGRNIGLAVERVFDHRVVGAANAHFGVAGADVQTGLEDECTGELLDLGELHCIFSLSFSRAMP